MAQIHIWGQNFFRISWCSVIVVVGAEIEAKKIQLNV